MALWLVDYCRRDGNRLVCVDLETDSGNECFLNPMRGDIMKIAYAKPSFTKSRVTLQAITASGNGITGGGNV